MSAVEKVREALKEGFGSHAAAEADLATIEQALTDAREALGEIETASWRLSRMDMVLIARAALAKLTALDGERTMPGRMRAWAE